MNTRTTGPQLCALIGKNPTNLSPAMHNAGFSALGLPFTYVAFNITNTEFALRAMREFGIRGFSVTIPHKEKAFALADQVEAEAKKVGAINTIINDSGKLIGYNTDIYGIYQALGEEKVSVLGKSTLILGAGGAARAAIYTLKRLGATSIYVTNRDGERGKKTAGTFGVEFVAAKDLSDTRIGEFNLIINATPIGSAAGGGEPKYPFSLAALKQNVIVFDFVTTNTPLLRAAKSAGAIIIPGIRMLLHQAVAQFQLFTGSPAPVAVMEAALQKEMVAG